MFTEALRELRHHPGRLAATIISIAISVGFLVGISVFIRTQGAAMGAEQALATTGADVVVQVGWQGDEHPNPKDVSSAIKGTDGVKATEAVASTIAAAVHDDNAAMVTLYRLPGAEFRWSSITDGRWPSKPGEVALSKDAASDLGVGVGGTIDAMTLPLTVVGITDDVSATQINPGYVVASADDVPDMDVWIVKAKDGVSRQQLVSNLKETLPKVKEMPTLGTDATDLNISTAEDYQYGQVKDMMAQFDFSKYMLFVFGAIALLVGAIIITTTFLILLGQRRRQIGLLRAVGASSGQVRRRVLGEAIVLGVVGSLLGVVLGALLAVGGAAYTKALHFGMKWPWTDMLVEFCIGLVITILAAFLPALRATRVAPLEALRPAPTVEKRKLGVVRIIVCSLLGVAGVVLSVMVFRVSGPMPIPVAVGAAICLSLTLIISTPLYVPWLIRAIGLLLRPFGPTARLSTSNSIRNPTRTSLTAVALMLAVGLSVTLQVGTSTTRSTVMDLIDEHFPVDLTVSATGATPAGGDESEKPAKTTLDPKVIKRVEGLPKLEATTTLKGGMATLDGSEVQVLGAPSDLSKVSRKAAEEISDGYAVIPARTGHKDGSTITVTNGREKVTIKVKEAEGLQFNQVVLPQADMERLIASPTDQAMWAKLKDRSNLASVLSAVMTLAGSNESIALNGGALFASIIEMVLHTLLIVMTALLGVGVLIALIGVANTLGLSVLERRRESALLRAMGMQRRSLRLMLLYEAIQTGMVGVIVGVVGGTFFAWLGIESVFRVAATTATVHFSVDWPWTLGLIGICLVAACLASILPGHQAATAAPTEALSDE